jgi:hypothetical protein
MATRGPPSRARATSRLSLPLAEKHVDVEPVFPLVLDGAILRPFAQPTYSPELLDWGQAGGRSEPS